MADEPLFTFYGAALTGKKPQHKVSVPAGRMLLLKQAALGPKPPANARATLSVQCDEYPQLVLCTLSTAMPQALIEVVCSNDATLTFEGTPGAALHVCGVIMDPPSKREKAGQRGAFLPDLKALRGGKKLKKIPLAPPIKRKVVFPPPPLSLIHI